MSDDEESNLDNSNSNYNNINDGEDDIWAVFKQARDESNIKNNGPTN